MALRVPDRLLPALRCPHCRAGLTVTEERVCCDGCRRSYPLSRGVPVLVDATTSLFDPAEIASARTTPTARHGLRRLIPDVSHNAAAAANKARLREELLAQTEHPLVLAVGAGEGGAGDKALQALDVINVDVAIGPTTHVAADAHRLPFADETFDAVVAQAVLEHVADPAQCVAEMHRVLKPDGFVYAETPFMQQVHMGAYDFTRFTELGHRRLFRDFEQVDAGPAVGPGSALGWSLAYFLASFARSRRSRRLLYAGGRLLFFWLRFFDRILRTDASHDAAAGYYFLGRRSANRLSDRELILLYRGGVHG